MAPSHSLLLKRPLRSRESPSARECECECGREYVASGREVKILNGEICATGWRASIPAAARIAAGSALPSTGSGCGFSLTGAEMGMESTDFIIRAARAGGYLGLDADISS